MIMLLFIAAALLGWEAEVGLVRITLQLPALGLSLLLGVRDGCQAAGAQVPVLESSLEAPHHPPQSWSSLLSEMTLLALHLPLVSQGTLTGPRLSPKEIKVKRSHLWVKG